MNEMKQERANELFQEVLDSLHFSLEYDERYGGYLVYDNETNEYRGEEHHNNPDTENAAMAVCHTPMDVMEELDGYVVSSFVDDMTDELESYGLKKQTDVPQTIGDIVAMVQEWENASEDTIEGRFYKDHAEEIAMMDLIANHISEVDLDAVYHSENTYQERKSAVKRVTENIMWDVDEDANGVKLPTRIEIPEGMAEDEIADYLSDITGFCHEGYELRSYEEKEVMHFLSDEDKMRDFKELTKEEFLQSYSYLTEEEYDATTREVAIEISNFYDEFTDEPDKPTVELILEEMNKNGVPATLKEYVEDVADWLDSFKEELSKKEIQAAEELIDFIDKEPEAPETKPKKKTDIERD